MFALNGVPEALVLTKLRQVASFPIAAVQNFMRCPLHINHGHEKFRGSGAGAASLI
jgi:hypothetical protein